jgi:hypothetical protein
MGYSEYSSYGIDPIGKTRFYGVYSGIVTNKTDPENKKRLSVIVPQITGGDQLVLVKPSAPSDTLSSIHLPAIGANVWIIFESGDPNYPVWMSSNSTTPSYYGSFYDTTTQTLSANNTPTVITLNTTAENNEITIDSTYKSRIKFNYAGTYNVQFSAQVSNNGTSTTNFWLRKNGVDVTWSNGEVTTSNQNHHVLPSWNYVLTLAANDYLEFVWMSNDYANTLEAQAATLSPASPGVASMIVTAQLIKS